MRIKIKLLKKKNKIKKYLEYKTKAKSEREREVAEGKKEYKGKINTLPFFPPSPL